MNPSVFISDVSQPAVSRGGISSWPAVDKWSGKYLAEVTGNQLLDFRMGRKNSDVLQWERLCPRVCATIEQFMKWLDGTCISDSPFSPFSRDDYWAYADYVYVACALNDVPGLLDDVNWNVVGGNEHLSLDKWKSTFWIGSAGSYTPCHYDTYSFNLVAQISGSKTWILFPPTDSSKLYPTRIPFEESTVYSRAHILRPDLSKFHKLCDTSPRKVVLHPGDLLYVPRHWWHSVHMEEKCNESDDISVSLNLWIDEPSLDNWERCKEALTSVLWRALDDTYSSALIHSLGSDFESCKQRTIDWAGDECTFQTFSLLVRSFEGLTKQPEVCSEDPEPDCKRPRLSWETLIPLTIEAVTDTTAVKSCSIDVSSDNEEKSITFSDVLRSVTDPRVIDLISKILLDEKQTKSNVCGTSSR